MDIIKDITYCYGHCNKQCERNLKYYDFSGQGSYSVSCLNDLIEDDEDCAYYLEKTKN